MEAGEHEGWKAVHDDGSTGEPIHGLGEHATEDEFLAQGLDGEPDERDRHDRGKRCPVRGGHLEAPDRGDHEHDGAGGEAAELDQCGASEQAPLRVRVGRSERPDGSVHEDADDRHEQHEAADEGQQVLDERPDLVVGEHGIDRHGEQPTEQRERRHHGHDENQVAERSGRWLACAVEVTASPVHGCRRGRCVGHVGNLLSWVSGPTVIVSVGISRLMSTNRTPVVLVVAAVVAFVAILLAEAIFGDEINWVTVILAPIATVVGILIGDAIRNQRTGH